MLALAALIVAATPRATDYSRPELFSAVRAFAPGKPFLVGLRFTIKPGWHVYWHNPGDSGQEIRVRWALPKGWQASPLMWPKPDVMLDSGFVNYGYERQVTVLARLTPSAQKGTVRANLDWLVCDKEMCLPGKVTLALRIGSAANPKAGTVIAKALSAMPKPFNGSARARLDGKNVILEITLPRKGEVAKSFLPFDPAVIHNSATQTVMINGNSATFTLAKSEYFDARQTRLRGIVVGTKLPSNSTFFSEIDVPLQRTSGEKP